MADEEELENLSIHLEADEDGNLSIGAEEDEDGSFSTETFEDEHVDMFYPDENESFDPFIAIFTCPRQSAKQRFGKEFNLRDLQSQQIGNNYDDGCSMDAPSALPQFEQHRMNLTALSQTYNLYFVAFRNQIYVYRPRNLDHSVPGKPDLVIRPPSLTGRAKPRSIFPDHPHCVNSMIVGDLGSLEILLVAFDDGDVYAYFTQGLEAEMRRRELRQNPSQLIQPRPLFSENLGDSAWGLAIHKSLRIIAVSCNDHRLRLFCFGLNKDDDDNADPKVTLHNPLYLQFKKYWGVQFSAWLERRRQNPKITDGKPCPSHWRQRKQIPFHRRYNTQITLNMGHGGAGCNNIPMLAFSNFGKYKDEILIGQDIWGRVFAVQLCTMKTFLPPSHLDTGLFHSGWACTILEPEYFMPTDSPENTFGHGAASEDKKHFTSELSSHEGGGNNVQIAKIEYEFDFEQPKYPALFRCSDRDVGLHPVRLPWDFMPCTLCYGPLSTCTPRAISRGVRRQTGAAPVKMSMLIKIPELSLMVVGNNYGLVALFTVTCIRGKLQVSGDAIVPAGMPTFRIEGLLPTKTQQLKGDRPAAPLMGIAASPMWEHRREHRNLQGNLCDTDLLARHFRLLLYYNDHTILSYELSRKRRVRVETQQHEVP